MRAAAVCFLAGVTLTGAAIVVTGQAPEFVAGFLVAIAAALAALAAIGPRQAGRYLVAIADALQPAARPAVDGGQVDFTEIRAEVVAELVRDGVDYDDADAAVSQTAVNGPRNRRAWAKRARALLNPAKLRRI